ncbi:phosphatidylserine decarboxylase 1 [Clonorchis sinensis]|uniref:phosphatidylserine decarboxylase n=1 Tax=Clonorchis sinensis TaxID=79923 RepID=A0A8T1MTH1_CLOSI|nr:phosphatidylserine decarboxylase 1 [Clonorchis sinensis]
MSHCWNFLKLAARKLHGIPATRPRVLRYRPFMGTSVIVGTYLGYLLLTDKEQPPEHYPNTINATIVRRLPLNVTSRLICWVAECRIPVPLRSIVYKTYSTIYDCNLDELKDRDLSSYPSLSDFFTRAVDEAYRPVDQEAILVSPADGQVLRFGPFDPTHDVLEQIKGVNYSLKEFLGTPPSTTRQKDRQLYQCVIYLGPGDCHRFLSPTDWTVSTRRHFPGKLLPVNPSVASRLPGLFPLNERVVYLGSWAYGYMSLSAVGAVGVGGIRIPWDPSLITNNKFHCNIRNRRAGSEINPFIELNLSEASALRSKGSEFGEFRLGSTIVLVFEAPTNATWCVSPGVRVRMGEALLRT